MDEYEMKDEMELHEQVRISSRTSVMRVPGGWLYTMYNWNQKDTKPQYSTIATTTFVPEVPLVGMPKS